MKNEKQQMNPSNYLLSRPLNESMGEEIIKHIGLDNKLPKCGFLAGQSVMSTLLKLYGLDLKKQGPINDIDIFFTQFERIDDIDFKKAKHKESLEKLQNTSHYDEMFKKNFYVQGSCYIDNINYIELTQDNNCQLMGGNGKKRWRLTNTEKLDIILSEFDLSCVQVGVDLSTGKMRWSPDFEKFIHGSPVKTACEITMAERAWLRISKKKREMPWMIWDEAQIMSSLHLAQIRTILSVQEQKGNLITIYNWESHYQPKMEAEKNYYSRHLTPIWELIKSIDRSCIFDNISVYDSVMNLYKSGQFKISEEYVEKVESIFSLAHMIKNYDYFNDHKTSVYDHTRELYINGSYDPVLTKHKVSSEDEFCSYIDANPDCIFLKAPFGKSELNYDIFTESILRSQWDLVDKLIGLGFRVDIKIKDKYAHEIILKKACGQALITTQNYLYENNLNTYQSENKYTYAIIDAAYLNKIEDLKTLLKQTNIKHIVDENGKTPLMIAVRENNLKVAQILIDAGSEINAEDDSGLTPLYYAITRDNLEMTRLLITNNADVCKLIGYSGIHPLDLTIYLRESSIALSICNAMPENELDMVIPKMINKAKKMPGNEHQEFVHAMESLMAARAVKNLLKDHRAKNSACISL